MAELIKTIDKSEYILPEHGTSLANIHIGGRVGDFYPNLNMGFELESGLERYYVNCRRIKALKGFESFANNEISVKSGIVTDSFKPVGDSKFRWLIKYDHDPRLTGRGDHVEEFELKFSDAVVFNKQPSTFQGFLDIEPLTIKPPDESIFGSYTVYQRGLWGRAMGLDKNVIHNANSGKLFHIYARKLYDSNGKEQWLEPFITRVSETVATMKVTIPAAFLDKALFPVFLNDTFGYLSGGATAGVSFSAAQIHASGQGAPSGDGTVTSIDIYSYCDTSTLDVTVGLYDNDGEPNSQQGNEQETVDVGTWGTLVDAPDNYVWTLFDVKTQNGGTGISVTNGTTYWPAINVSAGTQFRFAYDVGSGTRRVWDTHAYGDAWPATYSNNSSSAAEYGMRCTYTLSAGGLSIPIAFHHLNKNIGR